MRRSTGIALSLSLLSLFFSLTKECALTLITVSQPHHSRAMLPRVSRGQNAPVPKRYSALTNPVVKRSSDDSATTANYVFVGRSTPPLPGRDSAAGVAAAADDAPIMGQPRMIRPSIGSDDFSGNASLYSLAAAGGVATSLAQPSAMNGGSARRGGAQPHASRQGSISTSALGSFGIEGVKTGEEVVVSETERRQPRKVGPTDSNRDERRIRSLQAEVRALNEKLKRSQAARLRQKELLGLMLAEGEARRELELTFCFDSHSAPSWRLANSIARSAHKALTTSRSAFDKQVQVLQGRITEFRSALEAEQRRNDVAAREELEAKRRAEEARAKQVKGEVDQLKAELGEQQTRAAREKVLLESSLADTQNQLRQSEEANRKLLEKTTEDMLLVAQCRLFVKSVCQPGFNVVKGVGLEPVDKDRMEPTGFVLVPLVVLLHGYTLLPPEDRKSVIDHYESKAAAMTAS